MYSIYKIKTIWKNRKHNNKIKTIIVTTDKLAPFTYMSFITNRDINFNGKLRGEPSLKSRLANISAWGFSLKKVPQFVISEKM